MEDAWNLSKILVMHCLRQRGNNSNSETPSEFVLNNFACSSYVEILQIRQDGFLLNLTTSVSGFHSSDSTVWLMCLKNILLKPPFPSSIFSEPSGAHLTWGVSAKICMLLGKAYGLASE